MKMLILGSLLLGTTTSFAQALDVAALRDLFTAKKATLETVNAGMTKKIVTTSMEGACGVMTTSTQSVLKIEGAKMIILSKEKFQPQTTEACRTAGYTGSSENSILYYAEAPTLANVLEDLAASEDDIKVINRAGDVVSVNLDVKSEEDGSVEKVTIKYDLTKSAFKNMLSSQSMKYKTTIQDVADIDLKTVDLKKVQFCDSEGDELTACTEGDYSDILF